MSRRASKQLFDEAAEQNKKLLKTQAKTSARHCKQAADSCQ